MLRRHIVVRGDVQGVGFRYFTRQNASLYGICGWVKNMPDGSVEIDAEGNDYNMAEFIKAIKRGNGYSRVESVTVKELNEIIGYGAFSIR